MIKLNDTVTISLNLYNELRDFKSKMEDEQTLIIQSSNSSFFTKFVTSELAIKHMSNLYNILFEENKELKRKHKESKSKEEVIKELSWLQIIKIKFGK